MKEIEKAFRAAHPRLWGFLEEHFWGDFHRELFLRRLEAICDGRGAPWMPQSTRVLLAFAESKRQTLSLSPLEALEAAGASRQDAQLSRFLLDFLNAQLTPESVLQFTQRLLDFIDIGDEAQEAADGARRRLQKLQQDLNALRRTALPYSAPLQLGTLDERLARLAAQPQFRALSQDLSRLYQGDLLAIIENLTVALAAVLQGV